jgi:hypothetical protein
LPSAAPLPGDPTLLKKGPTFVGMYTSLPTIEGAESFEPDTGLTQTDLNIVGISKTEQRVPEEVVLQRIGPERIQKLSKHIDDLYGEVTKGTIADVKRAGEALKYLRLARDKELEDQRQFDEAEYLVNVAQYLVIHAGNVRQWSYTYGIVLLIYGVLWLLVFAGGLVLDELVLNFFRTFMTVPPTATSMTDLFTPYNTVMWGGIGGVLGLFYSLFKHVAVSQDFDRQFTLWYIVQPFMGMLMGAIVHLFFVAGVFQLVGATDPAFAAIGALLAIASAFRQNYVYAWLEAVLKNFQPAGGKEEEGSSTTELVTTADKLVSDQSVLAASGGRAADTEASGIG